MNTQEVIETLNELLQTTHDGSMGFRTCAKDVSSAKLTPLFEEAAKRCDVGAAELELQIRRLGGEPVTHGSMGGALSRTWADIVATLIGKHDHFVLEQFEHAEDNAKSIYEKALEKDLPADIGSIVRRQYLGVKENHDRIRMVRDQAR